MQYIAMRRASSWGCSMQNFLKHYQLRITALSPIHVGDGSSLGKKEYIQQGSRKPVIVPDIQKMLQTLCLLRRENAYAEFVLNDNFMSLGKWLEMQNIGLQYINSWKRYSMDPGDAFVPQSTGRNVSAYAGNMRQRTEKKSPMPKGILCFMKDAYEKPYVPGSTLKGMLRTALLCQRIHENPEKYAGELRALLQAAGQRGSRNSFLNQETRALETAVFHTLNREEKKQDNAVNSIMAGLIVSDSKPIDEKQLILAQKIDYNLRGEEHKFPVLREALKPGTQIDFEVTIDTRLCDVTIEEILAALEYVREVSDKRFYARFQRTASRLPGTVWLGGGTGFLSKTVLYPLYGAEAVKLTDQIFHVTLGSKVYDNHKHAKDLANNVAPHICKCTRYNGKLYDMGLGKIELIS